MLQYLLSKGPIPMKTAGSKLAGLSVTAFCVSLAACSHRTGPDYLPEIGAVSPAGSASVEYSFGVLPLHNAVRLFETYEPLIDEINSRVSGFSVKLETAKDHPRMRKKPAIESSPF